MKPIDRTIEVIGTLIDIVDRAECYDPVDDVDVIPLWHTERVVIGGKFYRVYSNFQEKINRCQKPVPGVLITHTFSPSQKPTPEDGNVSVIKLNRDSMVRIDGYNYKAEELL